MPPTKLMRSFVRGSAMPKIGSSTCFCNNVTSSVSTGAAEAVKGGPAEKAGLKGGDQRVQVGNMIVMVGGDIVVKADQNDVKTHDELIRYIREKKPGDTILLKFSQLCRQHLFAHS
jgi:S1-C subfamily serine protease